MKSLIVKFMAFVILANSLSWFMDGDFEAVINDHEIHELKAGESHIVASDALDDHHCQISSHFAPAVLDNTFALFGQISSQLLSEYSDNYLSAILTLPKRPPIAIS